MTVKLFRVVFTLQILDAAREGEEVACLGSNLYSSRFAAVFVDIETEAGEKNLPDIALLSCHRGRGTGSWT